MDKPLDLLVEPLADGFAAAVHGLDLGTELAPAVGEALKRALAEHKILVFRNQDLDRTQLINIAGSFGHIFAGKRRSPVEHDDLLARLEGNLDSNGAPNGRLYDSWGLRWHSDVSWSSEPGVATMLYSIILPDSGGDTEFADMQGAYDRLTGEERDSLNGITARHHFWRVRGIRHRMIFPWSRHPAGDMHNISLKERAYQWIRLLVRMVTFDAPSHPAVMVHPVTHRKSVYLGHHAWRINELPPRRGTAFVISMNQRTLELANVYRHKWQVGDLIIWDNQSLLHRLMPFDTKNTRRQMRRLVVVLDQPEKAV